MGGRGSSSVSARRASGGNRSLPNGAVAFSVKLGNKTYSYYENKSGMLMRGDVPGATIGYPVDSFQTRTPSIGEMYQRAVAGGGEVKLHSRKESDDINSQYKANRQANYQTIAQGEIQPNRGSAGISARRLLTSLTTS